MSAWQFGSTHEEISVPDFAEPLIGYRMWKIGSGDRLVSPATNTEWFPRQPLEAKHEDRWHVHMGFAGWAAAIAQAMGDDYEEPPPSCTLCPSENALGHMGYGCGIYAWSDFDNFLEHGYKVAQVAGSPKRELAIGTCYVWGRVIQQEYGYRAQFAALRSLYATHSRAGRIASKFGVELESIPRGLTYKERRRNG